MNIDLEAVDRCARLALESDEMRRRLVATWPPPEGPSIAPEGCVDGARQVDRVLGKTAKTGVARAPLPLLSGTRAVLVCAWAESKSKSTDLFIAPVLRSVIAERHAPSIVHEAARARVQHGPLSDAIACLPLAGDGSWLLEPDHDRALAKVELLLLAAGSACAVHPELARWLWGSEALFQRVIVRGSRGPLLARVLAARTLAISADGYEPDLVEVGVRRATLHIVRYLTNHPEPRVWIPAAIAVGRLAAQSQDFRDLLLRSLESENLGERRRAITSLAATKGPITTWLEVELERLVTKSDDPWELAAIGPGLPYLACERRELFEQVIARLRSPKLPDEVLWGVTQGLATLARRGAPDRTTEEMLRFARERATESAPKSPVIAQLHREIRASTDFLDGLDPDPEDVFGGFGRAVQVAIAQGPERVLSRAGDLARSLAQTFEGAFTKAIEESDPSVRGARLRTAESCALSFAVALWDPIARAAGKSLPGLDRDLAAARASMISLASKQLEKESADFALHRAALRVLGHVADAPEGDSSIAPAVFAVASAPGFRALDDKGLARFDKPIGDLLWRALDATRTSDSVSSQVRYARFLAWWSLAADEAVLVRHLRRTEAGARLPEESSARALGLVEEIRSAIAERGASREATLRTLASAFDALHAGETSLFAALVSLLAALFELREHDVRSSWERLGRSIMNLSFAAAKLEALIANPPLALSAPAERTFHESRHGQRLSRTIEALDGGNAEIAAEWSAGLGPVVGPVIEAAVREIIGSRRTFVRERAPSDRIGPYTKLRILGRGGQGEAWLVKDPNGRLVVVKIVTPGVVERAPAEVRKVLLQALEGEAEILKRFYHPNVANFVSSGVHEDKPYFVLDYLVGTSLESFVEAGKLTVVEAKPIIADVTRGLLALQQEGLVHCDLKPANIFLRMQLRSDEIFDPKRHRDSSKVLSAVIIDFGIARAFASLGEAVERSVSGTPGFIAPEQCNGEVHKNTDVYALAGIAYSILTGRRFFDELVHPAQFILAHLEREPLADPERRAQLPSSLATLLREATAIDPEARPDIATFAKRFQELKV
jgi:eukaryotic-like serine/threonine-protein kinase